MVWTAHTNYKSASMEHRGDHLSLLGPIRDRMCLQKDEKSFSSGHKATIPLDRPEDKGPWIYMPSCISPHYGGLQKGKGKA